ncbi:hypothetical protein BHM03_00061620 [Ensete ventricosum]|nr:hypothetical protein BHM03_00061620 [Ensete ventricosum]
MRPCKVGCVVQRPKRVMQSSQRFILHGVKDEGSFETHAPCLIDAFDEGTKVVERGEEATISPEWLSYLS